MQLRLLNKNKLAQSVNANKLRIHISMQLQNDLLHAQTSDANCTKVCVVHAVLWYSGE